MSRIEQALRRATGGSLSSEASGAEPRRAVTLEDYATESSNAHRRVSAGSAAAAAAFVNEGGLMRLGRRLARHVLGVSSAPPDGVEYYRRLAALMYEAQVERGIKTVVVTSAVPREGKTTTICNLAAALSESYQRRVLLVDADLRRPSVHDVFGMPTGSGLIDALQPDAAPARLVPLTPRLSILPAGMPNADPVAGLSSARMATVIKEAASAFDWVLLDTPPVGLLPDAQHITRMADAVLLVIAAGVTPYTLVQRAVGEIGADRILGTILNRVNQDAIPMTSYYGHYYRAAEAANNYGR
jgi:capsular exopolysaccharide synthesis family protein